LSLTLVNGCRLNQLGSTNAECDSHEDGFLLLPDLTVTTHNFLAVLYMSQINTSDARDLTVLCTDDAAA
jgi:hypothetical protein